MDKPELESRQYLDYNKCIKYIEDQEGIDFRDFDGSFKSGGSNFLDFWEVLLKRHDIKNGSIATINFNTWLEDVRAPSWEKEAAGHINECFWKYKDENGCLNFWMEW